VCPDVWVDIYKISFEEVVRPGSVLEIAKEV
jgi:hypothetical protein